MKSTWNDLQQMSKVALVGLLVVLVVVIALAIAGHGTSIPVAAGFVAAAAVLVVYTEYDASRNG